MNIESFDLHYHIDNDGQCPPVQLDVKAIQDATFSNVVFDSLLLSGCYVLNVQFNHCEFVDVN